MIGFLRRRTARERFASPLAPGSFSLAARRRHIRIAFRPIGRARAAEISLGQSATMPLIKSKTPRIRGLNEVGRYAVGVQWIDGHDSIFPLENLRRACPCKACGGHIDGSIPEASKRMSALMRLGEQGVFLGWV